MINSIKINNFQSHTDSLLQFSPGVNVIIGNSDSGKSAILRALRWVVFNKPSGDSLRSWKGGDTVVELQTADNHNIKRIRTNSKNEYALDSTTLKAPGADVPEIISQILKMDDINIQKQIELPFLISETAGAVAQHFNKMADLDIIHESIKEANSQLKKKQDAQILQETNLKSYLEELRNYADIEEQEKALSEIEHLDTIAEITSNEITDIENTISSLKNYENNITQLEAITAAETHVQYLYTIFTKKAEKSQEIALIRNIIAGIDSSNQIIERLQKGVLAEQPLKALLLNIQAADDIDREIQKIIIIHHGMESSENNLESSRKLLNTLIQEYNSNLPETCPTCGSKMKKI